MRQLNANKRGISPTRPQILWVKAKIMKKREAIIRYLAPIGRADRHLITNYIIARLSSVSFKLIELKHSGLVHNMKWSDGSKV